MIAVSLLELVHRSAWRAAPRPDDFDWSASSGWWVLRIEECWHRSLEPLMEEIRAKVSGESGVHQLH